MSTLCFKVPKYETDHAYGIWRINIDVRRGLSAQRKVIEVFQKSSEPLFFPWGPSDSPTTTSLRNARILCMRGSLDGWVNGDNWTPSICFKFKYVIKYNMLSPKGEFLEELTEGSHWFECSLLPYVIDIDFQHPLRPVLLICRMMMMRRMMRKPFLWSKKGSSISLKLCTLLVHGQ